MSPGAARKFFRSLRPVRAARSLLLSRPRFLRLSGACPFPFLAQFAFGLEPMVHILAIGPAIPLVNLVGALRDLITAESHLALAGLAIAVY